MTPTKPNASQSLVTSTRRQVAADFKSIIAKLPVEDLQFLERVVVIYWSNYNEESLGIVNAFQSSVYRESAYVLVRHGELRIKVEEYIRELEQANGRFRPKGSGWHLWKNPQPPDLPEA